MFPDSGALPSPPATPKRQTRGVRTATQSARKRSSSAPVGSVPFSGWLKILVLCLWSDGSRKNLNSRDISTQLLPMDGAAAAAGGGSGEAAANGTKSEGQQFDPSRSKPELPSQLASLIRLCRFFCISSSCCRLFLLSVGNHNPYGHGNLDTRLNFYVV